MAAAEAGDAAEEEMGPIEVEGNKQRRPATARPSEAADQRADEEQVDGGEGAEGEEEETKAGRGGRGNRARSPRRRNQRSRKPQKEQ